MYSLETEITFGTYSPDTASSLSSPYYLNYGIGDCVVFPFPIDILFERFLEESEDDE